MRPPTRAGTRRRGRLAAAGGVVALSAAAVLFSGSASRAAPIGTLAFAPATGSNTSTVHLLTSGPCTAATATNVQARIVGAGFPASGQVVVANSPISAYPQTPAGGYEVPLADTLQGFANLQNPPATLSGRYDFTLTCRTNVTQTSLGDFTGSIWFTSPTDYQSTDPTPTTTPAPTPTSTSSAPGNGSAGQDVGVVIPSHPTSSSSHPGGGGGGGGGGSGGGGGGGGGGSAGSGSAGGGGGLAHTGLPLAELVVAAAVLVVTGGLLARRGRRLRPGGRPR